MIPGKSFEPEDLFRLLRRRWAIAVPFVVITGLAATIVTLLPDTFRSETLIMVAQQQVPENYVRSTVTARIEDRLRSLNQQLTSRTRLEPLIAELHLYPERIGVDPMEEIVADMRRSIRTDVIRSDAFRISFTSRDPKTAMAVTERLASMYIEESLREREVVADNTNEFLDSQLATAKGRLLEQERKLEAYKLRYSGQLPSQVQSNLQVMQNTQMQIQSLLDSLNRDRDRRLTLQRQLADLIGDDSAGDQRAPRVTMVAPSAASLEAETATLTDMRRRLLDTHPDVVRQQRVVAELQQKVRDEVEAQNDPRRRPGAAGPTIAEAARQARIQELETEIETLTALIAQKSDEEAKLREVITHYQGRVEAAPVRESQLAELTRDYETLGRAYTSLLARKDDAQVSANLERKQIGDPFRVLDPARLPERPVSPNRPLLYAAGALLGLGAGLLLAAFLEFNDTSFKTDADVVTTLALPVIAMIPDLTASQPGGGRSWWPRRGSGASALILCLLVGVTRG